MFSFNLVARPAAGLLCLLEAAPAVADGGWVGRFPSSGEFPPSPWKVERLDERVPPTRYGLRVWDGVAAVEAKASKSMALFGRPLEIDLQKTPFLCWQWRIDAPVASDCASLNHLIIRLLESIPEIHVLRDPTRGGLATTLNEIARQSGVGIVLDEMALPVAPQVAAACEFLGLDPLHIANEGKLIAICPADQADALVAALRAHPLGAQAARIGEVQADERRFVQMKTALGGRRMVDWLAGEQLPRIC